MMTLSKKTTNDEPLLGKTSIIGAGMVINGEIISEGDIRIDGKLIGTVKSSSKVVVGENGLVEGDISAQQADITGKIYGNINIKDLLNLRGQANVHGEVTAGKISMEPSVSFNGTCIMPTSASNVVEMTKNKDDRKKAAE